MLSEIYGIIKKKLLFKGVFVLTRRYDFETVVNRFDIGSYKYDQMIKWNKMAEEKKIILKVLQ